ncbi:DEAD/DEAH box helicase [Brachybacterium sp. JHP9]|uniref:DEAD/DEAH box helicase n=1 Tax=Brachybacterium equifaecis TaxID=2910770 RepID=A0ABT0R2F8_9MICO|nr:DEAD/DEAH box helicase [Brachybacterium equifaecis]MCL6424123.1 DEAD/DEAH box helicase [Brachybacterium equifaecis]
MSSPSEAYAQFTAEQRRARSPLGAFRSRYSFDLDPFQIEGCEALQAGDSVLVAAPTGAGKTIVGEFAVHLALAQGRNVFYTAPIKALSNQKHAELAEWLGHERVGLLTGDVSVRPDADVVVMTTEVLRNMIYASSDLLAGLGYVVMDEVHYLADRLRGPVWEEIIIHLDRSVQLVALSATVSNAEEFGTWLQELRGTTRIVVAETRPVPLWQHVLVGGELLDLFVDADGEAVVSHGPGARADRIVNPDLEQLSSLTVQIGTDRGGRGPRGGESGEGRRGQDRNAGDRRHGGHGGHGRGRGRSGHGSRQPGRGTAGRHRLRGGERAEPRAGLPRALRRSDVVALLDQNALLPAIFFIFSRAGCDAAVRQLDQSRVRLTTDEEKRRIREILDERLSVIGFEDEQLLQLHQFRRAAENGFAAHHAGMLPLLKACIEELFVQALVKVVFATETLALGINMPARSVVLEKLSKFNGTEHASLTPGEYTQLTGRAGRRGIDTEGHAVVVAGPGFDADAVASLASTRTFPLRSAFRPTANMAVNLLARFDLDRARETLEMSFAQFQTDRSVVGLARRSRELEDTAESYRAALACERGDIVEYADLRRRIAAREKELSQSRVAKDRDRTRSTLKGMRRGEIVALPGGKRQGYGVVVDVDREVLGGPAVTLLGTDGRLRGIRPGDVPSPPAVVDTMKLPRLDRMSSAKVRKDTASALRQRLAGRTGDARAETKRLAVRTPSTAAQDAELQELRAALRAHPCHECPDLPAHERWLERLRRTERDLESVQRRIEGRTSSLARQFDRLVALLESLGYLRPAADAAPGHRDLEPTERGLHLRRLFSDRDLLVAECLEGGAWDDLDAADLAAIVSACAYEARRDDPRSPEQPPSARFDAALEATFRISGRLRSAEESFGIDPTNPPDPAVAAIMHRWARGHHLAGALGEADLTPGDFVRHCRQVIDLLEQLTEIPHVALTARNAIVAVRRGLVAQEMDR